MHAARRTDPLAPGSVSLRLYPHPELPAPALVEEFVAQARLAVASGFAGTMVSEHHNGFAGYLPNPVQAAGWVLEATTDGWAAPCPLLLPLRPTALVAEELAWMAARFPGRVAAGVAAGSREEEFALMGTTAEHLPERFGAALAELSAMLLGGRPGALAGDPAVARCAEAPIPLVSAAMSPAAVRRAAAAGVGLVLDSLTEPGRCRALTDAYVEAGGRGPVVLVRRVWMGTPPAALEERQLERYRGYAPPRATAHWGDGEMAGGDDPGTVARHLADAAEAVGADCLNLRVHAPGLGPRMIRDQITALAPVCDALHATWSGSGPGTRPWPKND
ncbi:MAG TPA: LLM class flavin-dependent oxidoreductase [Acidimicrobiales bacterium]|nr:LLM class flavin-dependent oxidoreductase [Acidimicrobiales bacterium]